MTPALSSIHPDALPFSCGQGEPLVLLVHGWTSSPLEMRPLAEPLAKKAECIVPLLKGHGTRVEDLMWVKWTEHLDQLIDIYDKNAGAKRPVILCGVSYGALLTLHLCLHRPVKALVWLAPFFSSTEKILGIPSINWARFLPPFPLNLNKKGPGPLYDPVASLAHFAYASMPLPGLRSLSHCAQLARKSVGQITLPTLLIHSRKDLTADYMQSKKLFEKLGSAHKKFLLLEKSNHIITLDQEQALVVKTCTQFLDPLIT